MPFRSRLLFGAGAVLLATAVLAPSAPAGELDPAADTGPVNGDVGIASSTVLYGGAPHVFTGDEAAQTLRHVWWTGSGWSYQVIDGPDVEAPAVADNEVVSGLQPLAAIVYGGAPHVFYSGIAGGNVVLRHAWWNGATWRAQSLDGNGGVANGHISTPVGVESMSVVDYQSGPHVFYKTEVSDPGSLRHAWWNGEEWRAQSLDGDGGIAVGRITEAAGSRSAVVLYQGAPHVFYVGAPANLLSLRHAWWDGAVWRAQTLDQPGGGAEAFGGNQGASERPLSVVNYQAGPHVFYDNTAGRELRHAWWTGAGWKAQTLDGPGAIAAGADPTHDMHQAGATVLYQGAPHVFYQDDTDRSLRHAWWSGALWRAQSLDGTDGIALGATAGEVANGAPSAILYQGAPHVFSNEREISLPLWSDLRHVWWNGAVWRAQTVDGAG